MGMSHTTPRPCPTCGHYTDRKLTHDYEPFTIQRGSDHAKVLKALRKKPRNADEIAEKIDRPPNEAAARLLELRRAGYVEYAVDGDTGRIIMRKTRRGGSGRVQRLTGRGKAAMP